MWNHIFVVRNVEEPNSGPALAFANRASSFLAGSRAKCPPTPPARLGTCPRCIHVADHLLTDSNKLIENGCCFRRENRKEKEAQKLAAL